MKKYIFPRTKKIMFTNNKGGVGKTTLCFNIGIKIAQLGYSVLLIDLDPQCNLTTIALGDNYYDKQGFLPLNTIYEIIEPVDTGTGEINFNIQPSLLPMYSHLNIKIVPGDLALSKFENSLQTALLDARSGNKNGYVRSSALQRYLNKICLTQNYDVLLIDTGPSLGLLNNVIFLMSDYFIVPMMPDSFSVKGIKNLGSVFTEWKTIWEITGKQLANYNSIPTDLVLDGKRVFLGYVINSYNIRNKKPIIDQQKWLQEIPKKVKEYLSTKHSINGLVELSHKSEIGRLKDIGKLAPLGQRKHRSFFHLDSGHSGTYKSQQQAEEDMHKLTQELLFRLSNY